MHLGEMGKRGLDSSGSGQEPMACRCGYGDEPEGSADGGQLRDQPNVPTAFSGPRSNPAEGAPVCPRVSVLTSPVQVEALRRADHPATRVQQISKNLWL
jgi:hypothetical protein